MAVQREEEFYREIDDNQLKPNFGCLKIIIFFIVIALISGSFIFYLFRSFRNSSENIVVESLIDSNDFQNQTPNQIVVKDEDINAILDSNQKRIPIEYLEAETDQSGIVMKGFLQRIRSRIEFVILPKVVNNALLLEVKSVKIGKIKVPSWFGGQVSSILTKELQKRLKAQNVTNIENIVLEQSKIIIYTINE